MTAIVLTLSILSSSPSATTLAAVAVFVANTDRQWPVDEREPFVTAEALRLMEVAGRALADDWGVNTGDLRESIEAFSQSRVALEKQARGDADRPRYARDALAKGEAMLSELAAVLDLDDATLTKLMAQLEDTTADFDRKRQVRQQADVLESFFHHAAAVMRELVDAPPPRRSTTAAGNILPRSRN